MRWLALRVVCAPPGSGKTAALAQYCSGHPERAYVQVPHGASATFLSDALRSVASAREIVIDDVDRAAPEEIAALLLTAEHTIGGLRYLVSATSREPLQLERLLPHGFADWFDASLLAFDAEETTRLARALHVAATEYDVAELLHQTEGWPVAVAAIVREAARTRRSLPAALDVWCEKKGFLLLEYVAASIGRPDLSETFQRAIRYGPESSIQAVLQRLEAAGFPVVRMRTTLRPYRIFTCIASPAPEPTRTPATEPLTITLFGRFACTIGERRVVFPRRREQDVLAYVALSPSASVPRAELLRRFWPDATPAVASQGLRTTLSRIRHAIGGAGVNPARYFHVGPIVALDLAHVAIDARRFREHVEQGRIADGRGDAARAAEHYRSAERLYGKGLLASEAVADPLAPGVSEYAALFQSILVRLVQFHLGASEMESAKSLARRLVAEGDEGRARRRIAARLATTPQPA